MGRIRRSVAAAALVFALAGVAEAQSAPSLSVTLGFIRDKIAQQGQIYYSSSTHDSADNTSWDNQFSVEASGVIADEAACTVSFHWRTMTDGKATFEGDTILPFRIVTSVTVSSMADDMNRMTADEGHTTWRSTVQPSIWVAQLHRNDGAFNVADFRDGDVANRVATAMRHAADLCGGTKSEPF